MDKTLFNAKFALAFATIELLIMFADLPDDDEDEEDDPEEEDTLDNMPDEFDNGGKANDC
jgi:hypothetical protein